jgi:STE24 endopeptidase
VNELFSVSELEQIRAYHEPWYAYSVATTVVTPVLVALFALRGPRVYDWCDRLATRWRWAPLARIGEVAWRGPGAGTALLFGACFFGFFSMVGLPGETVFDLLRERQFGLSTMSTSFFAWAWLKGHLVGGVAISCFIVGVFGLARRSTRWWLVLGGIGLVGLVASTAIDPYRRQLYFKHERLADGPLRSRLESLLAQEGVAFADIVVEKTAAQSVRLQAYFAGTGPTRSIVLNDVLVSTLTTEETVAAVAHEMGHLSESRWVPQVLSGAALLLFLLLIERLFCAAAWAQWFGVTRRVDVRVLPLVVLLFDLAALAVSPVSAAVSRQREREADAYAVRLTRDPASFRSMLVKAARTNKMNPAPPRWYVLKGLSHPRIVDRLADVDRLAAEMGVNP